MTNDLLLARIEELALEHAELRARVAAISERLGDLSGHTLEAFRHASEENRSALARIMRSVEMLTEIVTERSAQVPARVAA